MPAHPDQHYIEAIRRNDPAVLRRLIAECYPPVEGWVCQNGGTHQDAQDVFGDALEAILRKLHQGGVIEMTAKFPTFIFSICRNQWLKRLRQKKFESGVRTDDPAVLNLEGDDWTAALEESERMHFFRKKVAGLSESCRRLLAFCWQDEKVTMEAVAAAMGFASANYASKRKHECIEILKERLGSDPEFDALK